MEFEQLVIEFCAAVEAGDGARLGALFTPEGIYHDTFYGEVKGRAAIASMLEEQFYGHAERFLWEPRDMVCQGRLGYARWLFSYSSTLPESAGRRVAAEGMSCFELEGGLISRYSECFDAGKALVQLGFAPARLEKLLRRWAEQKKREPAMARHLAG